MRTDQSLRTSPSPEFRKARGISRCWMVLRHSCCRFGWYPALVAPILTIACLLSLYSGGGCDFIRVDVGFTPQPNAGWNESQASLGFWYYEEEGAEHDFDYVPVYGDCAWYQDGFDEVFIENDRTWKVARIMAMVAGLASTVSALVAWLFCLTPLPPGFLWPVLFLPIVMVAFIAEGSKFLLFDIGVCRTSVWLPSGVNSLPQKAESCELGESAYYSIAAGAFLLVGLLLVCLRVPHERELDPHFGMVYIDEKNEAEDTDEHHEDEEDPRTYYGDEMLDYPDREGGSEDDLAVTPKFDTILSSGRNKRDNSKEYHDANASDQEDVEVPSESRSNTLANMEASQAQETSLGSQLLEKLVDDLNCSYQTTAPKEETTQQPTEDQKEESTQEPKEE